MDYAIVKLKGFANSEEAPPAEDVDQELAVRRRELASLGRFLIARSATSLQLSWVTTMATTD